MSKDLELKQQEEFSGFTFKTNSSKITPLNILDLSGSKVERNPGQRVVNRYKGLTALKIVASALLVASGENSPSTFGEVNYFRQYAGYLGATGSGISIALGTRNTVKYPNKLEIETGEWKIENDIAYFQSNLIFKKEAVEQISNLANNFGIVITINTSTLSNNTKISMSVNDLEIFNNKMQELLEVRQSALEEIINLDAKWKNGNGDEKRLYTRNKNLTENPEVQKEVLRILKNEWKLDSVKLEDGKLSLTKKDFKLFEARSNVDHSLQQKNNEFLFGNNTEKKGIISTIKKPFQKYNVVISQSLQMMNGVCIAIAGFTNNITNWIEGFKGVVKIAVEGWSAKKAGIYNKEFEKPNPPLLKDYRLDLHNKPLQEKIISYLSNPMTISSYLADSSKYALDSLSYNFNKFAKFAIEKPFGIGQQLGSALAASRIFEGLTAGGLENIHEVGSNEGVLEGVKYMLSSSDEVMMTSGVVLVAAKYLLGKFVSKGSDIGDNHGSINFISLEETSLEKAR